MKKTLKITYAKDAKKVTIESTAKKLYGTLVWVDKTTGKYYSVERSTHLGRTIEAAIPYNLTKEEFEAL